MKPHPIAITIITIVTLTITISEFTNADSLVPLISRAERRPRITTAGMLTMPWLPAIDSNGEWDQAYGIRRPNHSSTRFKYSLHAIATVAAPTAYSSTRSQPTIHATSSPIVASE